MGLLDDAIREHLDLKRRRGADPAEIERAEREALGPVRRGPEPVLSDDLPPGVGAEEPLEYDEAHDEPWEEPFDEGSEPFPGAFPEEPPSYEQPAGYDERPAAYEPLLERDAAAHEEPLRREEPIEKIQPIYEETTPTSEPPVADDPLRETGSAHVEPASPAPAGPQPRSDETAEYSIDEEPGKQGEDVLEETPEFLQDTPEHDRLWFEQRPPRDFDFNE